MHLFITLLCFATVGYTAKSTKFRMEKVNFIYDKAMQHIKDQQRLLKLEADLSGFDKILIENKEKNGMGKPNKEEEATVERKLRSLLEKYDLEKVLDAFEKKQEKARPNARADLSDVIFGDEKLQKLWSAAKTQKFANDELEELHSELVELEKKQRLLEDALGDLNKVEHENHVDSDHDAHLKAEVKNKRAKEANRAVHTHYEELHRKVLNQEFTPFENAKVKKMWATAQQGTNFTAFDLDVIREELIHFDKQLKKLHAHTDELSRTRENSLGKESKSTLEQLENTEMEAKHERLDRKLKKLEKYLVTKLKHSEL